MGRVRPAPLTTVSMFPGRRSFSLIKLELEQPMMTGNDTIENGEFGTSEENYTESIENSLARISVVFGHLDGAPRPFVI